MRLGMIALATALGASACCSAMTVCSAPGPTDRECRPLRPGSPCAGVDLREDALARFALNRADFQGANLEGVDLSKAKLRQTNMIDAKLARAKLVDADLTHANLKGADLKGADLTKAVLVGARLDGQDLTQAVLRYANLKGAHLDGAKLDGVDWFGVVCPDGVRSMDAGGSCAGHLTPVEVASPEPLRAPAVRPTVSPDEHNPFLPKHDPNAHVGAAADAPGGVEALPEPKSTPMLRPRDKPKGEPSAQP